MKLSIARSLAHDGIRGAHTASRSLVRTSLAALLFTAPALAQSFCEPANGATIPCPCNNPPVGSGRGCNNSLSTGGSALAISGNASTSNDTLVISASGIGSTGPFCTGSSLVQTSILIQGTTQTTGVPFFDGVRCVGGVLKRIQTNVSVGGTYTSTVSISATSASLGDTLFPTAIRMYFVYYRDPCPAFACTGPSDLVNASNAWKITWS
jgi:hypothetical protein